MASGYLDFTSRYWRISAVGAAACTDVRAPLPASRYFLGAAAFFLAGFALGAAFPLPAVFFFARRALSFLCRVRRRIFIDRRLSRRPMRSQYPDSSAAVKPAPRGRNNSGLSCIRRARVLAG